MKAYIKIFLPAFIFLQQVIHAQHTLLTVGDKAPELKVYKWVKGTPVVHFKKGQIYVVDFGATWCVPCAESIPHLTDLAKKFGNKINVIGVFVMEPMRNSKDLRYVQNVIKYVNDKGDKMKYNVAVDDPKKTMENTWLNAAALQGIPQLFLIDKNGLIASIGNPSPEYLSKMVDMALDSSYNISDAVEGYKIRKKSEEPQVDHFKPLFVNGNGGDRDDFLYRSLLTKYDGEKSGNWNFVFSMNWATNLKSRSTYAGMVQQVGVPLLKLYYMAYADTMGYSVEGRQFPSDEFPDSITVPTSRNSYGKYWYTPILEIADTMPFHFSYQSNQGRYNYSLVVPDEKASAKFLQEMMRQELKLYFGYKVIVKDSLMPYWKLIATENGKKALATRTPGQKFKNTQINDTSYRFTNAVIKDILTQYILPEYSFGHIGFGIKPKKEAPFLDETGITGDIDYEFSTRELDEMLKSNWDLLLQFLHRLGLVLVKGERMTKVIVIRDPE